MFRHTFTSHASVLSVHVHVHVSSVLTILWIDLSPAGDVAARVAVEVGVSLGQADGFDGVTEGQQAVQLNQRNVISVTVVTNVRAIDVGVLGMDEPAPRRREGRDVAVCLTRKHIRAET